MQTAASSQVRASTATAQPEPTVTTNTAPTLGPMIIRPLRLKPSRTFACCKDRRSTISGTTPNIAGKVKATMVPFSASNTMRDQISAVPLISSIATIAWVSADSRCETCRIVLRLTRSATTRPSSMKTAIGMLRAASTQPRSLAESLMSSTANASAIGAIVVPRTELVRPAKYQRNRALLRGASVSLVRIAIGHQEQRGRHVDVHSATSAGGLASACSLVDASWTASTTCRHTRGSTHSSASVVLPVPAALRMRSTNRRSSSVAMARAKSRLASTSPGSGSLTGPGSSSRSHGCRYRLATTPRMRSRPASTTASTAASLRRWYEALACVRPSSRATSAALSSAPVSSDRIRKHLLESSRYCDD